MLTGWNLGDTEPIRGEDLGERPMQHPCAQGAAEQMDGAGYSGYSGV